MTGARFNIYVRINAALGDELELAQTLDQWGADRRALANQHERLGVLQPLGQDIDVLGVLVPDFDIVSGELGERREMPDRVEVVVEDRYIHEFVMSDE